MKGKNMNSFLVMDDEDVNFIWKTIQEQQIIFHPEIAPFGEFDYKKFFNMKSKKPIMLFLDRNILSGLLRFCEQGSLTDKRESQILGLIMTWAEMNDVTISAGLAIQEYATQTQNQDEGLRELQKFLEIFETYPGQVWLRIAEGQNTKINPLRFSGVKAKDITVDYSSGCDHYFMMVASMIHIVKLYRRHDMKPVEKILDFLQWTYDNLLLSQYALAYVALLFTGQENIKAPKGANTNNVDRIIAGCENQAWDISYLSNWSTIYGSREEYPKELMFATNDVLLKRIFINVHGAYGVNGLLHELFSKKDYNRIYDYIEERMENRIKPDWGNEPEVYLKELIEKEKNELLIVMDSEK